LHDRCRSPPDRIDTLRLALEGNSMEPQPLTICISHGDAPAHGYAIATRLEQISQGSLQLSMGTLYPGLIRVERRGLVQATWGSTDNNRKARFYAITTAGRRQLAAETSEWTHGRDHRFPPRSSGVTGIHVQGSRVDRKILGNASSRKT
jgi:DNA-binding PadR family transcriptional regulator